MTPLVSVIIPAYNAEPYVRRALCSSLEQTYRNLEIVVVDDGSTDGTAPSVQEIRDPRIVYTQHANAGQGNARNRGIRECRGNYIALLDAQDLYMPGTVQRQLEFLVEHTGYKVVYSNALYMYSDKPGVCHKKRGKC